MKIAVVGGGITGSVVASELTRIVGGSGVEEDNNDETDAIEVVLFDQGRRGPGGRASHRSVAKKKQTTTHENKNGFANEEFEVLPDDEIDDSAFQFDHGCQFFRADSPDMKDLVEHWLQQGWVAPWKGRFGSLPETTTTTAKGESGCDFFGLPSSPNNNNVGDDVYIGVGGMHRLPRKILEKSSKAIEVHRGTRVSGVTMRTRMGEKDGGDETHVWDITTTVGVAAFHDTKESEATAELSKAKTEEASGSEASGASNGQTRIVVHRGFDAVVFTDISSSSESWHRASAGIPPSFAAKLPPKLRLPLFSCMIALEGPPIGDKLPYDAFCAAATASNDDPASPLWFAARSDSKPGFPASECECWTLISTPSFAVDEIKETTMRDPVTGAFRPQENDYLNSVPGPALRDAFFDLIQPYLGGAQLPKTVYLQAQRWGSGLPIDPERVAPEDVEEICGTTYASHVKGSLVYSSPSSSNDQNFVADDDMGLYYGGDFCSHLNPGFEAAALSGLELARHIRRRGRKF